MSIVPVSSTSVPVGIASLPTVENDVEKNKANIEAIIDAVLASSAGVNKELAKGNLISKFEQWPSSTMARLRVYSCIWYTGITLVASEIHSIFIGSVDGAPISSGGRVDGLFLYDKREELRGLCTYQIISTPSTTIISYSRENYVFAQFIADGWIFPGSSGVNVYNGSGLWI